MIQTVVKRYVKNVQIKVLEIYQFHLITLLKDQIMH